MRPESNAEFCMQNVECVFMHNSRCTMHNGLLAFEVADVTSVDKPIHQNFFTAAFPRALELAFFGALGVQGFGGVVD